MENYINNFCSIFKIKNTFLLSLIVASLLILIDCLNIISILYYNNLLFLFILLIVFLFVSIFKVKILKMIYFKHINKFDDMLLVLYLTSILLLLYVLFFDIKLYKLIILLLSIIILEVLFIIRIKNINQNFFYVKDSVIDLEDLINRKIELNNKRTILLEEKEVNYDLLNRKHIINQLYNTIIYCEPKNSFTIGLNGHWGSGKTTIVNNVLRLMEYNGLMNKYVIVQFDPWKYDDEKSILKAFLNDVLNSVEFNLINDDNQVLIQNVLDLIFDYNSFNIGSFLSNEYKSLVGNIQISSIVNNYLHNNNKKLLIIIDNLDRIDGEKALFLIKCLDSVIDFEKTINVLLYDENIIDKMLEFKFNSNQKYMNKLVQLKIEVPEVSTGIINELKEKITNNILIDGVPFLDFINNEQYDFKNIRDLKLFINSIITSNLSRIAKLNEEDDANLKYIKTMCPYLYYKIWEYKKYFIYYDRKFDDVLYEYDIDVDKLNKEATLFFDDLLSHDDVKKLTNILSKLFPSFSSYLGGHSPFSNHINETLYNQSINNYRICNYRYFDLYFTSDENIFIKLNKDVDMFIDSVNGSKYYSKLFVKLVQSYNYDELKVFAEILNINLFKINNQKKIDSIYCIYNSNNLFYNRVLFFELDSYKRFCIIIADLLLSLSAEDFLKFKETICNDFKNLYFIYQIKYWIENNKKKNLIYNFDFDSLYTDMCNKILKDNINIYSEKYYNNGNIWALYHFDNKKTIRNVSKMIDSHNIYDFLADLVSISYGSNKYGYMISKKNFELLAKNVDVDNLLQKNNDKLDVRKKLIKDVYDMYKSTIESNSDELSNSVYRSEYIEL